MLLQKLIFIKTVFFIWLLTEIHTVPLWLKYISVPTL